MGEPAQAPVLERTDLTQLTTALAIAVCEQGKEADVFALPELAALTMAEGSVFALLPGE